MEVLRHLLRDHRNLAMLLMVLALCVKAVVPQGYMLGDGAGERTFTAQLCFGGTEHRFVKVTIPTANKDGGGKAGHAGAPDAHCPYTSLSMAADGGADAPLLAIALAFIVAAGLAPLALLLPRRAGHTRPPLRGPPSVS